MVLDVHGKNLPVPSFFQVYNFGGGNGDKNREIVYSEFTEDTPALFISIMNIVMILVASYLMI